MSSARREPRTASSPSALNLSYRAKAGSRSPKTFTFPSAKNPGFQVSLFRYADADLAAAEPTAELLENYSKPGFPWRWLLATFAALIAAAGFVVWRRSRKPALERTAAFAVPSEINALTVLGLLRRIRERAALSTPRISELDKTIAELRALLWLAEPSRSRSRPDSASLGRPCELSAFPPARRRGVARKLKVSSVEGFEDYESAR
jgi:hypothetical protein